jgi:hypothetical protein
MDRFSQDGVLAMGIYHTEQELLQAFCFESGTETSRSPSGELSGLSKSAKQ